VVSDHGFGQADRQFNVNAWLRARRLLAPVERAPTPEALDESSLAFALDTARIYLNRAGRFPRGTLPDRAAADLCDQLATDLRALRWSGWRAAPDADGPLVFDEVWQRDEVYHGPQIERAPDLIAVPARGIQARGSWQAADVVTAAGLLTGTHTRADAVLSVPWRAGTSRAEMADVAPTLLAAIGVHPAGLDGADLASRAHGRPLIAT
jgi:predicted AlkP superfamily phosphohydrolase/phosphomutase